MKIILTETQLKKILEQKSIDIVSVLKQMGFVPSGNSIFKHSEKPELTITLGGDILIIKLDGKDPSDMGFAHFTTLVQQAEQFTFSDLFSLKLEVN